MRNSSNYLKACCLIIIAMAVFISSAHSPQAGPSLVEEYPESIPSEALASGDYYEIEDLGYSVYVPEPKKPVFPDERQLKLIGRLADGIYKWKARVRDGQEHYPYYECGVRYTGDAAKERALLWAYNIVRASWEAAEEDETLNEWGVAGTVASESAFDLCAFGTYPRKAAYQTLDRGKPILKPSKLTASHTYKEVVYAINHPKLKSKFRTYDLGGLQVLALYYDGPMEKLLTWEGFYWQVNWMMKKQRRMKTERPWAYWPGHYAEWKHQKVAMYARQIGATSKEI